MTDNRSHLHICTFAHLMISFLHQLPGYHLIVVKNLEHIHARLQSMGFIQFDMIDSAVSSLLPASQLSSKCIIQTNLDDMIFRNRQVKGYRMIEGIDKA